MKKNNIKIIIASLSALVCMACIWPLGLIRLNEKSASRATDYMASGYVKDDITYTQSFVPQQDELTGIMIKIVRGAAEAPEAEGSLTLTLYDSTDTAVAAATEPVSAFEDKIYHEMPLGVKVEKGSQYYYTIAVEGAANEGVQVLFGDTGRIELPENQMLIYDGQSFPMYSTMAVYNYTTPLDIANIAMYDAWIVMLALFMIYGTGSTKKKA